MYSSGVQQVEHHVERQDIFAQMHHLGRMWSVKL